MLYNFYQKFLNSSILTHFINKLSEEICLKLCNFLMIETITWIKL